MSSAAGKRRRALPLTPGKTAQLNMLDVAELDAARLELARVRARVGNVTARLRRQLGDAEIGVNAEGEPVLWREQAATGGAYVRVNHRDDLRREAP